MSTKIHKEICKLEVVQAASRNEEMDIGNERSILFVLFFNKKSATMLANFVNGSYMEWEFANKNIFFFILLEEKFMSSSAWGNERLRLPLHFS